MYIFTNVEQRMFVNGVVLGLVVIGFIAFLVKRSIEWVMCRLREISRKMIGKN